MGTWYKRFYPDAVNEARKPLIQSFEKRFTELACPSDMVLVSVDEHTTTLSPTFQQGDTLYMELPSGEKPEPGFVPVSEEDLPPEARHLAGDMARFYERFDQQD